MNVETVTLKHGQMDSINKMIKLELFSRYVRFVKS